MRAWVIIIALMVISNIFSPAVSALPTAEHVQLVTINPDPDKMVWNSTFNMSDPANRNLSNYNQTIVPFMNNTSIDGVFTGTFLPPMIWKVADNTSYDKFYFMQLVRFRSSWIMSGSSVSWWRVPVLNITDWDYLSLFIYRVGNPGLLRLNESQPGVPNPASRPLWVYSENYWAEAINDTWYEQNVTAWGQNFTHYWLRVDAPIHSDETYLVGFYVDGSATVPDIRCQFAQTDLSEDQLYESYIHNGGSYTTLECDLDISVIHQYGMGHTVSGWEAELDSEILWEEDWMGIDGEDIYTYDSDWEFESGDNVPPPEIDDDQPGPDFTWSMFIPSDSGNMYFKNFPSDPLGSLTGNFRIKSYVYTQFNGDLRLFGWGASKWGSWYHSNGAFYLYYNGGQLSAGGYAVNNWYEVWMDINTVANTIAWWLEDTVTGEMYLFNDRTYTAFGGGSLKGFKVFDSKQAYCWLGSITVETLNPKTLKFYSRTEENVTDGDNVTFMMPFIKDITNASNAEVTIKNINGSWTESYWVAENGPTDFTIKSLPWAEVYSNKLFSINVTFQNQSNMIFIHDKYSDNYPWWHTQYPDHNFQDHYPTTVNVSTTSWRHLVWFRPYHSLQVTDGQWVQTHLDPIYMLDGRVVDPEALAFREAEQSDPWAIYLSKDELEQLANLWGIADTLMFGALPDLDAETLEHYFTKSVYNIKDVAEPIFVLVGYFVEAVDFIVDAISQMFAAVVKGIALFVFIPFFFFTCLLTNGAKRFFIITARDGPEAAVEYGSSFISNSIKISFKSQPIALIARRGRRGG